MKKAIIAIVIGLFILENQIQEIINSIIPQNLIWVVGGGLIAYGLWEKSR